jgi:capsular polysaccharide biosynthesis protein
VLKRDLVLVIGLIAAVVVGTATSTSAMQPQSKSTESMHIKTSSKKKTNRIQRAGADVGRSTKKSGKAVAKSGSKTSKAVAKSSNIGSKRQWRGSRSGCYGYRHRSEEDRWGIGKGRAQSCTPL